MKSLIAFILGAVASLLIRLEITPAAPIPEDIAYEIEDDDSELYTNFNLDNPFVDDDDVYATAFIYDTLYYAMLSTWPSLSSQLSKEGFEAIQNIVRGIWVQFTTADLDGDYAILFEAMRLMQRTLVDFTNSDLSVTTILADNLDVSVEMDTFFELVLAGENALAINVAKATEARFKEAGSSEGTGVQALTVVTVATVARNWSLNEWPDFVDADVDGDDE